MKRSRARSPEAIEFARSSAPAPTSLPARCGNGFATGKSATRSFAANIRSLRTRPISAASLKLILEIDGADHFTAAGQERDRVRDEFLSRQGYRVVRISGYEVLRAGNEVLELIREEVARRMQELRVEEK